MSKILLVATVQSHIAQFHKPLMQLLKEYGWEIHVAARDNLNEKGDLKLEYPDKVFNVPFQRSPFDGRNFNAYKELKALLKTEHYDVIHCNTPVGGILARIAGNRYRKSGTLVYYTAHGFHFYKGASIMNWIIYYTIEKWMSRFTDKLLTITQEDYNLSSRKFHCKVFRTHGVGVDEFRYTPIDEKKKNVLKRQKGFSGPVILNIGELLPNKNQKMAVEVMEKVVAVYPDAVLLIAGNGPEEENIKRKITDMGLQNSIRLIGYCTNLQDYQHIADVLIACSYREGLPLNIVEAMLSNTPVVATNNRGHRELIKNNTTGYLVDMDDVDDMANKVCSVLKGDGVSMVENARDKALNYGALAVRKELMSIYCLN